MSNALFLGTREDEPYVPYLKGMFNGVSTYVVLEPVNLLAQLEMYCAKRNITRVVSTNREILSKLLYLQGNSKANPSLDDYAGSLYTYKNVEIVFVNPLKQLFTVSYGKFICERFVSKVVSPEKWTAPTAFNWYLLTPDKCEDTYNLFSTAFAIAVDIETFKKNLAIRCIGYTAIFISPAGAITTTSVVLPITDEFNYIWMRKFNDLSAAKIFQNGKYDNSYLLRYDATCRNWLWDTKNLFHCWYSELPKDLAFLNAFFVRTAQYWKDLAETTDLHEYYRYNALDTWATANVWIAQMLTMPDWAKHNYLLEFPLVYPCLLSEMTGLLRDPVKLEEQRTAIKARIVTATTKLAKATGQPTFNANSPKQVKTLFQVLGNRDIESTDENSLNKLAYRHPLNNYFVEPILEIRGDRKLISTYLRTDDDADKNGEGGSKDFKGTVLYALNPDGTSTARLTSNEHAFWCGVNIQNQPRTPEVKSTIIAAEGFLFGECDLEQAESRDTAHISGDERLIAAVSGTRDFHSVNAASFFGKPYEVIYDDTVKKTKDKPLRDLAKRVNHGANYNMGAGVLVDTMGLKYIYQAKGLLKLSIIDPIKIAEHLLERFHATYPKLRGKDKPFSPGTYYAAVCEEVITTRKIVSRAYHHTEFNLGKYKADFYIERGDWTRYCFGKPDKNKSDLNSYVAHPPQSLNARTLNEAYMRVFYEIALPNPDAFRLHAQIHDSILFSYKNTAIGNSCASRVKSCMEIPVTVRDISGTFRTFTVPAALKMGKSGEGAKYWSETE